MEPISDRNYADLEERLASALKVKLPPPPRLLAIWLRDMCLGADNSEEPSAEDEKEIAVAFWNRAATILGEDRYAAAVAMEYRLAVREVPPHRPAPRTGFRPPPELTVWETRAEVRVLNAGVQEFGPDETLGATLGDDPTEHAGHLGGSSEVRWTIIDIDYEQEPDIDRKGVERLYRLDVSSDESHPSRRPSWSQGEHYSADSTWADAANAAAQRVHRVEEYARDRDMRNILRHYRLDVLRAVMRRYELVGGEGLHLSEEAAEKAEVGMSEVRAAIIAKVVAVWAEKLEDAGVQVDGNEETAPPRTPYTARSEFLGEVAEQLGTNPKSIIRELGSDIYRRKGDIPGTEEEKGKAGTLKGNKPWTELLWFLRKARQLLPEAEEVLRSR